MDARGNYRNSFTAIPHVLDVPPPTPYHGPPVGTPELAEVFDVLDPQKLGRIRVRYYWPVEQPQQAETDWLRVLTPYSGDGKGQLFVPERGSQVLVGYQGSLAGQPLVLGNLFHARNPQGASYSPPGNNLKGLQTAGGNKVVMLDTAGQQTILLSNSNKKGTAIQLDFKGDGSVSITTNGSINLTAGEDSRLEAGKNITLQAGEDTTLIAQKNVTLQATEQSVAVRGQQEVLLTAVEDNLTLAAAGQKLIARAADNVEITASGATKISGQDVKLNTPG